MVQARLGSPDPLVKVVFHFQQGNTLQLHLDKPIPQTDAMLAIGQLCHRLGVHFTEVMGFGMDTTTEQWEVGPHGEIGMADDGKSTP